MFGLRASSVLLLFLFAGAEVIDFDKNELCYICTCNYDGSSVDCSRKGLTDVPDGTYDKVTL